MNSNKTMKGAKINSYNCHLLCKARKTSEQYCAKHKEIIDHLMNYIKHEGSTIKPTSYAERRRLIGRFMNYTANLLSSSKRKSDESK